MRTRTALLLVALLPTLLLPPSAAAHVCFARGAWASVCSLHVVAMKACCRGCDDGRSSSRPPRIGAACACCGELALAETASAAPPDPPAPMTAPPAAVRVDAMFAAPPRVARSVSTAAAAPRPPPRLKPLLV
jgi:hypothetical protein